MKQFCFIAVAYYLSCVSLITIIKTRNIFLDFFQIEQFLAVKVAMGYEKSMSCDTKLSKRLKEVKQLDGLGSFNIGNFKQL